MFSLISRKFPIYFYSGKSAFLPLVSLTADFPPIRSILAREFLSMADFFEVPGKKSSYHAKKFLNHGKSRLRNQKHFEALENFNKSLCFAETGSEDFALACECRAEAYREIEKSNGGKNLQSPWEFYKLSHPANEKIPFVAACLELQNDENFGRYITTSLDLRPGDIIAIEEPFFKIVDSGASHTRCANCLRSNAMNLVPSDLSSSTMFCSPYCTKRGNKVFHNAEVTLRCIDFTQRILLEALNICDGSFEKLSTFVHDPETASRTIYDFDWKDEKNVKNQMHGLLAFNALQLGPINEELEYVATHPVLNLFKSEQEKDIAREFMTRVARILTVNCYSLDWWSPKSDDEGTPGIMRSHKVKVGSALLIFGSLFNHSCAPNIDRMIVDNKFVFIVRRPIKAGEQLFISYGPSFVREPGESRQANLKAHFHFECSCEACMRSYPISFNLPLAKEILVIESGAAKPVENWIAELRRNCQAIEKGCELFPNLTLCRLMDRNLYLMAGIAQSEPFLF